jgi:hypothetical protein
MPITKREAEADAEAQKKRPPFGMPITKREAEAEAQFTTPPFGSPFTSRDVE